MDAAVEAMRKHIASRIEEERRGIYAHKRAIEQSREAIKELQASLAEVESIAAQMQPGRPRKGGEE